MKKFLIRTFGCQMNKDDSQRIAGLLINEGYLPACDEEEADVIIFNTCCVRKNADDRLYGQVGALKPVKRERPDLLIAVGGCLAQMEGTDLQKKMPHVDVVFGTHNVAQLPALLEKVIASRVSACQVDETSRGFTSDLPAARQDRWRAWLPITVGCDNHCTYCIVPRVRGPEKSRPREHLVQDCRDLVKDGVKEVTLLGQNVNSYGRDLYGSPKFAELLKEIATLSGLERIRFVTSHPKDLYNEIIETVASEPNVCPHFHLPLQSGSDRILKAMNRKYSSDHYLSLIEAIRQKVDDVSITTDIMVGFPGETEEDFIDTLRVVKASSFDNAFTFIYSKRPGTAAAELAKSVPPEVIKDRFSRLINVQNENSFNNNKRMVGKRISVYIDGLSKKSTYRLAGRTNANKLVHMDGEDSLIGQYLSVEIEKAYSWFMVGKGIRTL